MFHFRAPSQDVSFPDGILDDGVFHGDQESRRSSILLGRGAGQAGPLPRSPLPQSPNPGPRRGEEGQRGVPTGELATGAPEGPVSSRMLHILSDSSRDLLPISL